MPLEGTWWPHHAVISVLRSSAVGVVNLLGISFPSSERLL